jgi:hypothetical protein
MGKKLLNLGLGEQLRVEVVNQLLTQSLDASEVALGDECRIGVRQTDNFVEALRAALAAEDRLEIVTHNHVAFDVGVAFLGDEELGAEIFIRRLHARRDVHGIANGGDLLSRGMTDAADYGRSKMDAHAK